MDEEDYIYNGILLIHKKEWNPTICNNTDGLGGYYAKWNKSDRDGQMPYTQMWNLRQNETNEQTKLNKNIGTENRLVVTKGEGGWGVGKMGEGGDFPGGTVVKNPPANAGDTGSSPGPGRFHMPQSNWAREPQLLSLRCRARKPQLLSLRAATTEPARCNYRSLRA